MKVTPQFATAVHAARDARGETQKEFGARFGVSEATISRIENPSNQKVSDDLYEALLPEVAPFLSAPPAPDGTSADPDVAIFEHADGRITRCNDGLCSMLGKPREKIIGLRPSVLIHPDAAAQLTALMESRVKRGRLTVVSADGAVSCLAHAYTGATGKHEISMVPFEDAAEQADGASIVIRGHEIHIHVEGGNVRLADKADGNGKR